MDAGDIRINSLLPRGRNTLEIYNSTQTEHLLAFTSGTSRAAPIAVPSGGAAFTSLLIGDGEYEVRCLVKGHEREHATFTSYAPGRPIPTVDR